jgi:uncharacterized protein
MSADNAQREPTMEEILASIRRIISEEDKPAEAGGDVLELQPPPAEVKAPIPPPPPKPEPVVAKAPPPVVFDEPEEIAPPPRAIEEDLIVMERTPEPPPAPRPVLKPEWTPSAQQEPLVSEPVAHKTAGELGKLMGSMFVSTGNTLDDVVRQLLKPMLKEWLDANLPQIVEAEVAKEIDRIRRMSR